MNIVDLIVLVVVIAGFVRGAIAGAARQIVPFGAVLLGLVVGAVITPFVAGLASTRSGKAVTSLVAFIGIVFIFSSVGEFLGARLAGALRRYKLGVADAGAGAAVAVVSTLLTVWLLAGVFARVPTNPVSEAINDSTVVQALDDALPPIPSVFSRLGRLLNEAGFPDVFAGLEPAPADPVALPDDPAVRAAVAAAGASTVRIVGAGCGGTVTGSGFVVEPGLVVTNAHVIAGIDRPSVEDNNGRHRATPVLFDPELDIAVLRTSGLSGGPLALERALVARGTQGAVLGYPGGGRLTAGAGAVLQAFDAVGRDIYGGRLVRRNVYQLRSEVRAGNSGGPFVRANGEVLGVIFSASATEPNVGYALTGKEVGPNVDRARASTGSVDTGDCAT